MPPVINKEKCDKCAGRGYQVCVEVCPTDVFLGSKKAAFPVVTYPDECWHENACVLDCPVKGAVTLRIPMPMTIIYK